MKIAIVAGGQNVFGKEIVALELGAGLKRAGHAVSFVSSRWWGNGEFPRRLHELDIPARFMRLGFISATLRWNCIRMTLHQFMHVPGLWWDYMRFLREEKPGHVIHTNWHHLLMLWPFLSPKRDWYWLHDVVLDKPQYRRLYHGLARKVRGFVPVSEAVKASLVRIGIVDEMIHVIHNGIADPTKGGPNKTAESTDGIRIGIVGQVAPWKGHQDLLEAFGMLAAHHPAAELHVFGDDSGEFARQLKERALELGVDARLVWHGFVTDKGQVFGLIDLCVVPSSAPEALPTVAIEAAFFGLPVVASRIGGLPEIIEEGVTGLLHAPGKVTELAACLERLLKNETLRRQMGMEARRRAAGRFGLEQSVAEFERLFSGDRENVS